MKVNEIVSENRKILYRKENFYSILIIILIFSIDRYFKTLVLKKFNENIFFVNNYINLDLVWNTGIGFGLLSFNSSFFYNIITLLISLVILFLFFMAYKSDKYEKIIFSVIIGGALGNFYDRVFYNAVPDFIDLHYNSFHWFTFNFADIFITIGILLFLVKEIFIKNDKI